MPCPLFQTLRRSVRDRVGHLCITHRLHAWPPCQKGASLAVSICPIVRNTWRGRCHMCSLQATRRDTTTGTCPPRGVSKSFPSPRGDRAPKQARIKFILFCRRGLFKVEEWKYYILLQIFILRRLKLCPSEGDYTMRGLRAPKFPSIKSKKFTSELRNFGAKKQK